jgi:hypothetical protein
MTPVSDAKIRPPFTATAVLMLVIGGGCDSPTRPSLPPITPPSTQPAGALLVGYVRNTAFRAIPDARIQIVDGSGAGASAMTDAAGQYVLQAPFTGAVTVLAEKAGYVTVSQRTTLPPGFTGSHHLNFIMAVDGPSLDLTGAWSATLQADAACEAIPDELRTRIYTATFVPDSSRPQSYRARLDGADFLYDSPAVSPMYGSVAGSSAYFQVGYFDEGIGIVERLTPSGYLEILADAEASASESRISGLLRGRFEYCPSGHLFKCEVQAVRCAASALTLVRR